jgi:cobaltochelatase CobS
MLTTSKKAILVEKAFGLPVKGKTVVGLDDMFNPAIPNFIEDYCFPHLELRSFLAFMEHPEDSGFWLWGLHGTGKTSLIQQVCNRLNWGCYSINGSATLEIEELLYQNIIKPDGTTGVELNALSQAFAYGGVFLFNEIDLVDPGRLGALNEILAGDTLIIPGYHDIIKKHENFRFVVTANTNGSFDDESGIDVVGSNSMNLAFMDRFIVVKANYLDAKPEIAYLSKYSAMVYQSLFHKTDKDAENFTKQFKPIIQDMVKVAGESRKAAMNGNQFDRPISMRGLKRWVQKTIQYTGAPNAVAYSLGEAITNAYPKSQADSVVRFCSDVFGQSFES